MKTVTVTARWKKELYGEYSLRVGQGLLVLGKIWKFGLKDFSSGINLGSRKHGFTSLIKAKEHVHKLLNAETK